MLTDAPFAIVNPIIFLPIPSLSPYEAPAKVLT